MISHSCRASSGRTCDRIGHLDERRGEQAEEREREVLPLVHGGRRQHEVAEAGGVGDVEVDRDAQLEVGHSRLQLGPVGNGQNRVSGRDEERPDLPLARRRHLLRHDRRRQAAQHLGQVADPRAHPVVRRQVHHARQPLEVHGRVAEDGAALAVEVAGDQVQGVQQERDHRRVPPEARPGSTVDGGALGAGEVAREAPDLARLNPGMDLGLLRGMSARERPQRGRPAGLTLDCLAVLETVGEDGLEHREQEEGVAVGVDRDVLEHPRGLRAARIDDDHAPAALGDRVQLVLHPRRAHHAAVRDQRVGADHQEEVGAGEVRDRHDVRRPVQERARREAVRNVLAGRRVEVRRAEGVHEALGPERVRVRERRGVAHVVADRVAAVLGHDSLQPRADLVQRPRPTRPARTRPVRSCAADGGRGPGRFGPRPSRCPWGTRTPADSGCSESGRSFTSLPSSTVATMPQSGSQIRQ